MKNVTITKTKDIHIIKLEGLLNVESANNLEVILNELMINETPRKVIFDFSNLEHISSSGLRVIMNFYKKIASKNGKLIICCAKEGIKNLISAGADFIAIPCNTIHIYFEMLQSFSKVPLLNIVDEVAKFAKEKSYKKLGVMATKTTIDNKLYDKYLKKFGIEVITPTTEQIFEIAKIIHNVERGKILSEDKEKLREIAKSLENKGADAVVLGCTELPIVLKQEDCTTKLLDSTQILAEATVKRATQYKIEVVSRIKRKNGFYKRSNGNDKLS